jgi:hypothetical protein
MTDAGAAPRPAPSGPRHPFRAVAVERYERPLIQTTPRLLPRWRWWRVLLGLWLVTLAGWLWR